MSQQREIMVCRSPPASATEARSSSGDDILLQVNTKLGRPPTTTMSVEGILLTFRADNDGTGELVAEAQSGGFRGHGSAWFGEEQLHEFAAELRKYPLPPDPRPTLAGGFWSQTVPTQLEQAHLVIEAYPVGVRGQIGLRVKVSRQLWERDRPESQDQTTVEVLSTYNRLQRFARELDALVSGDASEAVLEVETLM